MSSRRALPRSTIRTGTSGRRRASTTTTSDGGAARRRWRNSARAASSTALAHPRAARPRMTRQVLLTLLGKLLGLALLLGSSYLMYDLASSPAFRISRVTAVGNRLLAAAELEAAASVSGSSLFQIRGSEVIERLRRLPPVESARVSLELPDHLLIELREREPVAIWLAGETAYLVDDNGLVLAARQPERPLMVIRDVTGQPITVGGRVNADAVKGVARIDTLLSQAFGPQQREYQYAQDTGMNVIQQVGPRLILGNGDNLEWKIEAIRSITRYLEASHTSAELIDVRFGDRPYFR